MNYENSTSGLRLKYAGASRSRGKYFVRYTSNQTSQQKNILTFSSAVFYIHNDALNNVFFNLTARPANGLYALFYMLYCATLLSVYGVTHHIFIRKLATEIYKKNRRGQRNTQHCVGCAHNKHDAALRQIRTSRVLCQGARELEGQSRAIRRVVAYTFLMLDRILNKMYTIWMSDEASGRFIYIVYVFFYGIHCPRPCVKCARPLGPHKSRI